MEVKAVPLVVPLSHPERTSLGFANIRRFVIKWKDFQRTLKEREKQEGIESRTVSLRFSIEKGLLEDLVALGQSGDKIEQVEQVKDITILDFLEHHVKTSKYTSELIAVDRFVETSVRMNMN